MPPPVKPNLSSVGSTARLTGTSPVPLSQVTFSEEDFKNPSQMVALLNRVVTDHTQVLNQILGYPGGTPSIGANQGVSAAELKAALQEQRQVINQTMASGSTPAPVPSPSALPIPESQIINLITDLAACEKIAHKDQPSGYPSLDATTHIPIAEIPVVINVNGSPVVNVADFNDTTPASDTGYINAKIRYTGSFVSAEVGLSMPPEFSVSGSPVTPPSSLFFVSKVNENVNTVYAGPASGSPAVPTFRSLDPADYPTFVGDSGSGGIKGAVPAPAAGDAAAGKILKANGAWDAPTGGGGVQVAGDIGGTTSSPTVVGTHLSGVTQHGVLVAGASGATASTAVGTSGQVLTSNGAGNDPTFQAAPSAGTGALTLLEQHSASNSAELDFTACLSSAYDDYLIELVNLVPATNGGHVNIQFSTNGGSSYDATSGHYSWGGFYVVNNANANVGSDSDTRIALGQNVYNTAATGGLSGTFHLFNPASTTQNKLLMGQTTSSSSTNAGKMAVQTVAGSYLSTTAVTAFRVIAASGNLTSGTVRVYGVANS